MSLTFANLEAKSHRSLMALSVYKRGIESEHQRPCNLSSVMSAPAAAAAVVPPRQPECSP